MIKRLEFPQGEQITGIGQGRQDTQEQTDFIIQFKKKDRTEIAITEKKIPYGIDVIAKEFPIRVIHPNGEIQELIMNIRAW